jgi:hypothetical protein
MQTTVYKRTLSSQQNLTFSSIIPFHCDSDFINRRILLDQQHQSVLSSVFGQEAMPVAKPRRIETTSGFAFINVTHPNEIRQRSTQRAIRSGAMAAIGRTRRKRPEKPVIVELHMPHTEVADCGAEGGLGTGVPTTLHQHSALPALQGVPPALPHLGIFAIEPDKRARELLHFSM